jgi:nucleoside-diphosphate-sugar epimerase
VLASTSSLYGGHNPVPFSEDADTSRPLSPYAASKKAAEAVAFTYHHLHGLDISVLRYFTVYGPAGRPDMSVFRFMRQIAEREPITVSVGIGEVTVRLVRQPDYRTTAGCGSSQTAPHATIKHPILATKRQLLHQLLGFGLSLRTN